MIKNIESFDDLMESIESSDAIMLYFSTPQCRVCKVLKPKIHEMLQQNYPKIDMYFVDTEKTPEASGQFSVFAAPTIILFFDSKEFIRQSRNIGISELSTLIERPYSLFFDD